MKTLLISFLLLFALGCTEKVTPDYTDDFVGNWKKENKLIETPTQYVSLNHSYVVKKLSNSSVEVTATIVRTYNYVDNTGLNSQKWTVNYTVGADVNNSDKFEYRYDVNIKHTAPNGVVTTQLIPVQSYFTRNGTGLKLLTSIKVNNVDFGGEFQLE